MKTNNIIRQFSKLTSSQKHELFKQLEQLLYSGNQYLALRQDIITDKGISCIHCNSNEVIQYGTFNGKRRFKCKSCNRTFNELTGTAISCVKKKEHWERFIKLTLEDRSIRYIAKELQLSTKTVFEWRHKVLSSFNKIFTKKFKGIVETDDVLFKFDQKGRRKNKITYTRKKRGVSDQKVAVMVTMDRYKAMDMKVVKLGRISQQDLERIYDKSRFNQHNTICSDRHRTITSYFKSLGMEHKTIYSSKKQYVIGKYHVNHVNNLVARYRTWMRYSYKSVATKYLQNYLFLFQICQILKDEKDMQRAFLKYSLQDSETIKAYRYLESQYEQLLAA